MNGTEPKIEIFKPFGQAFELMKKILFQPFDLGKWCVIGFAAFLASLSGGSSYSFNPFSRWDTREDKKTIAESFPDLGSVTQMEWWVIALIVIGGLIILALAARIHVAGSARSIYFYGLHCVQSRRHRCAMERVSCARKQFFPVFAPGHAVHSCRGRSRGVGAVSSLGSQRVRCADRPGFLDRSRAVRVFHFVSRVRLGVGFAVNDTDYVPPTLPGAAGLQAKYRINHNSPGPDASLFPVSACDFVRCRSDQLRRSVRDLLHRCDPVHRHSHSPANSGHALRILASVSTPIRLRLRCMGEFYPT